MKQHGFTLIELMIVIAIIGIVAAIGYPSYTGYVKETRRSDAQVTLLNAAQYMERCKTTRFSYVGCTIPAGFVNTPEGFYTLSFDQGPTARKFTLKATAQGLQASDTDCLEITMNELTERLPAECWK